MGCFFYAKKGGEAMSKRKMTEKQKRFCDYYIESGNATEAARKAGYKKPNPQGAENLAKPSIKKYIEKRIKELETERTSDMQEVQEFWAATMRNPKEETKDRIKASELIAKTHGAFLERVEHSGSINNPMAELTTEELKELIALEGKT
jgi:phage terminase small subunit